MKHFTMISNSIPAKAQSPAEVAGMFSKLQTMSAATTAALGTLTAGVGFWNLINNPAQDIPNAQKNA